MSMPDADSLREEYRAKIREYATQLFNGRYTLKDDFTLSIGDTQGVEFNPRIIHQTIENILEREAAVARIASERRGENISEVAEGGAAAEAREDVVVSREPDRSAEAVPPGIGEAGIAAGQRIRASVELRRRDSLARLLVSSGVCSAVYIDDEQVVFTTNDKSYDRKNLEKLLNAFARIGEYSTSSDVSKDRIEEELLEIITDISFDEYRKTLALNDPVQLCKKLALVEILKGNQELLISDREKNYYRMLLAMEA